MMNWISFGAGFLSCGVVVGLVAWRIIAAPKPHLVDAISQRAVYTTLYVLREMYQKGVSFDMALTFAEESLRESTDDHQESP